MFGSAYEEQESLLDLDRFSELVQATIAAKLTTSDLARLRAVSKPWKAVADSVAIRQAAFRGTWGLSGLDEEPQNPSFYLTAGLGHFAVKVKLDSKISVASLVVRFKTDSLSLRVLNNCASDFSLQCRPYVYIPVNRCQLLGRRVTFAYDKVCSRQLAVLQDFSVGGAAPQPTSLPADTSIVGTMDSLARGGPALQNAGETKCRLEEGGVDANQSEALIKKLSRHMGKGLNIDEGTASYYLDLTGGDMKRAFVIFKEDLAWETDNPRGILPLREQVPIPE